jgi:hypothetical protein
MTGSRRPGRSFMVPADFFESDEYADLVAGLKAESANSATVGWFRLLAAAKRRNSGAFASEAMLRRVLGHFARWLPRYRDVGFLSDLTIRDWDLWQEDLDSDATRKLKERRQKDADRKAKKRAAEKDAAGAPAGPLPGHSPKVAPASAPPRHPEADRPSDALHAPMSADSRPTSRAGAYTCGEETKVPPSRETDEWAGFDEEWTPFRKAWVARRFGHPPTPAQRAILWGEGEDGGAIRDWSKACGRWVAEAPVGARAAEVIAFVLRRYHEKRKEAAGSATVAGRDPSPTEAKTALTRIGELLPGASHQASPAYETGLRS